MGIFYKGLIVFSSSSPRPLNDIETAKAIVIQFSVRDADENVIEHLLNQSKGSKGFRPYWVAAFLIKSYFQRIQKADEVSFQYSDNVEALNNLQSELDKDAVIPDGFGIGSLQSGLLGISIY